MKVLIPRLVMAVAAAVVLSCATSTSFQVSAERLVPARALPPIDPAAVRILKQRPAEYEVVGRIRVQVDGYRWRQELMSDPALASAVVNEAASLGANAVMEIDIIEHRMGGNSAWWGFFAAEGTGRRPVAIVATAIRTQDRTQ